MTSIRIFDTFLFDGELALLEHRLAETADLVDVYVIVEAGETFRGQPKPMVFAENRSRFAEYAAKIRHITLRRLGTSATDPWDRERRQREAVHIGLHDARPNDIVLLLDADEIPSRAVLQRLHNEGIDVPRRLLMTRHYEAVDLLGPRSPCCADTFAPFAFAHRRILPGAWQELGIEWFSFGGVAVPYRALTLQSAGHAMKNSANRIRRHTPRAGALADAGRHLTFVDPSANPARKLGRVTHAEWSGERGQSPGHLARCRRHGVHHRGWWYAECPAGPLPGDLQRLLERQPDLVRGNLPRSMMLRRAVRTWAWARCWNALPDAMVRIVDRSFESLLPVLLGVLLLLDLCRTVMARTRASHPTSHRSGPHQSDSHSFG